MITYPATYPEVVSGNHDRSTVASVLRGSAVVATELPVLDGYVNMSRSAGVRRACELLLRLDDPLTEAADLLMPYGNEIQLWSRVAIPDVAVAPETVVEASSQNVYPAIYATTYGATATETVEPPSTVGFTWASFPLGVFRIANPRIVDEGAPTLVLTGYDRSRALQRSRFIAPYTVPKGTPYVEAIGALVQNRLPGVQTLNLPTTEETSPLLVFDVDTDPWTAITSMATALGMEAFFDELGTFVLQPEPDPAVDPAVWVYRDGAAGATLLRVERDISDEPGYNGVVCVGESTSLAAPIRRVVWDNDPTSPTFHLGPYGEVPMRMASQFIATGAQADAAARAMLRRVIGLTEAVRVAAIPNPAQELGDTVRLQRTGVGLDDNYLVEGIEMPLGVDGEMLLDTRKRRTVPESG